MAQADSSPLESISAADPSNKQSLWRKLLGQGNGASKPSETPREGFGTDQEEEDPRPGLIRRVSRKVVPGLPRAQTFMRQQAEVRNNLEPIQPTQAERRAASVDRRFHTTRDGPQFSSDPRSSAPEFTRGDNYSSAAPSVPSAPTSPVNEKMTSSIGQLSKSESVIEDGPPAFDTASIADGASMTTSQYDAMIHDELERVWILNLSMHFRDKSKREKFFVTYRERNTSWRRVTISLDYRGAPDNSLEMDLLHTKFQRDKSAKIYEAIRESLVDIQFYESVTNLKLQTTEGRLHVHVVEDVNVCFEPLLRGVPLLIAIQQEIIHYPTVRMIQHLRCRRVKEREIDFDSHMSGFVYKVRVNGETLIKKEIPGPDTVDEFLYEINALNRLRHSHNVIQFYGVIVDDNDEYVKGLLISYADQGALIDVLFDHDHSLPWMRREKWARQIVEGLSEIHEAGFVQGDFTLSNIVIDDNDDAKIIDINRRGCPVGWEPPEATPLIESNQRISMYIGVKSDLYQLGMVLWALAEQEDEPESHGRPLTLGTSLDVPRWYRTVVDTCLADDPRIRVQALNLLLMFPDRETDNHDFLARDRPSISVDDGHSVQEYFVDDYQPNGRPMIRTVHPPPDWSPRGSSFGHAAASISNEPYYFPTRGRSPPSPMPSNIDLCEPHYTHRRETWAEPNYDHTGHASSDSNLAPDEFSRHDQSLTPQPPKDAKHVTEDAERLPQLTLTSADEQAARPLPEVPTPLEHPTPRPQPPEQPTTATRLVEEEQKATDASRDQLPQDDSKQNTLEESTDTKAADTTKEDMNEYHVNMAHQTQQTQTQQNPLFRGAGITEPGARDETNAALVLSAAEIQQNESASKRMGSQQEDQDEGEVAGEDEEIVRGGEGEEDVVVEKTPSISPSTPSRSQAHGSPHGSKSSSTREKEVPDELRGCGAFYDDELGAVRGDDGRIDDDDLVMLATATTE